MPVVLTLLKNKNVWIILAVLGAITYHYITVSNLEVKVAEQSVEIIRLESNLKTAKSNTAKCTQTNKDNKIILEDYEADILKVEEIYFRNINRYYIYI